MNSTNPKPPLNHPMKSSNHSQQKTWSELPPDLLLLIVKRLATQPDVFSFRRVCKLWRASAPLSVFASKNMLSPLFPHHFTIKPDTKNAPKHYIVCMNCVILLRSNVNPELPPFIITVDEYTSGKLYVRRPFCAHPFTYYSDFEDTNIVTRDFPRCLDLSRYRVLELARFPTLSYVMDDNTSYVYLLSQNYYARPNKVVLFADPNCENRATINDYTLVELVSQSRCLILNRLRNGERHRFIHEYKKKGRRLIDLVNFKGKVYVIDNYHREKEGSVDFSLFKVNEKEKKWEKLKGIGDDKILFLTYDGSFVALTNDFPGCKGNCIIFFRIIRKTRYIQMSYNQDDYEIYVFHFDGGGSGPIASYPGYSDVVVWPPPSWLYGNDSG
ncbi:F-box protein At2g17036-like [Chenopodium quinoa]|nr:F-box protein At2g17036-like [Chenopodium quinoa]